LDREPGSIPPRVKLGRRRIIAAGLCGVTRFRPARQVHSRRGGPAGGCAASRCPTRACGPVDVCGARSQNSGGNQGRGVNRHRSSHHTSSMNHRKVTPAPLIRRHHRSRGPGTPRAPLPLRDVQFPETGPGPTSPSARSRWLAFRSTPQPGLRPSAGPPHKLRGRPGRTSGTSPASAPPPREQRRDPAR